MLIVRDIFTTKPGQASRLAKLWKRTMGERPNVRVLTDLVGPYNTVVMEMEVESLAEWEELIRKYMSGEIAMEMSPEDAEAMKNYTEHYQTGRREIFKVVE
jgi:hypothetical protein